ncbi:MAG: META domain-containing protein, partial [Actinomycetota bacterium]|nr:META domain-containing protein [Actinomycetota bacterium]
LFATTGCGTVGADRLDGTSWRLAGWSISAIDPTEFTITLGFDGETAAGQSAVNSYGGNYSEGRGGKLELGEIASTLMAGPEPAMNAEAAYFELLGRVGSYAMEGSTLTLRDSNGNDLLIFEAQSAVP